MKRALVGALGLAMVVAVFGASTSVFANHIVGDHEITIASPQNNTAVAVGSTFTFTMAVTTSQNIPAAGYKAVQWEVAYPNNVSFVSATYTCSGEPGGITFPAESE